MTATPPAAPSARPRVVTAAFWCSAVGAILLIAGGSLAVTISLTTAPAVAQKLHVHTLALTVAGAISVFAGLALGFLSGRTRNGDDRFRRPQVGVSIGVAMVVVYLIFNQLSRYLTWPTFFGIIPAAVGAVLLTRPAAVAWFGADQQKPPDG
jgi:hypothetical protein